MIAGEVSIVLPKEGTDSEHYLLFWGKDEKTRLGDLPAITQFEINKIKDGLTVKEIQVSTLTVMDQNLQVSTVKDAVRKLKYEWHKNCYVISTLLIERIK